MAKVSYQATLSNVTPGGFGVVLADGQQVWFPHERPSGLDAGKPLTLTLETSDAAQSPVATVPAVQPWTNG